MRRNDTKQRNGKKLYEFRKEKKLSMEQLGMLIGKSGTQVYRYEKGYHQIPKPVVKFLKRSFNLDIDMPEAIKRSISKYADKKFKRTRNKVMPIEKLKSKDAIAVNNFSNYLRDIRDGENLTLVKFAAKYDMCCSHLWKLEQGMAITLRISTLSRLKESGYDLNALF